MTLEQVVLEYQKTGKYGNELVKRTDNFIYKVILDNFKHFKNLINDLFQEGRIGILIAAKKFDESFNVKFLTYAYYWIVEYLRKCIRESYFITPPHNADMKDLKFCSDIQSLDAIIDKEHLGNKIPLIDFIESDDSNPEEILLKNELLDELFNSFKSEMTEKEYDILMARLGFRSGKEETLEELGHEYNCTKERIRQLQASAISKIKDRDIRDRVYELIRY